MAEAWEADQVKRVLDLANVPTQSYEAQGGGMCEWTLASRVQYLVDIISRAARLAESERAGMTLQVLGEARE